MQRHPLRSAAASLSILLLARRRLLVAEPLNLVRRHVGSPGRNSIRRGYLKGTNCSLIQAFGSYTSTSDGS